jgi:aryl-alcohol dehydrogenase-like predicted oxidoreductase
MKTRQLGTTGAEVSALCLGAMLFGTRTDQATSTLLLDQYVEAGGSFIDTANIYAHWVPGGVGGESEQLLGRWMKERNNRQHLFLASKVWFQN